ncbi:MULTISPECIES: efflux RND transporter periplasmic adaptor subunit [Alphaproteobacteria]|uniref:efflux RND transporter periplasmic adaptor subunit n=1 Tax=Alphaproteobacteria TaxID=28211 RepID=UPI0024E15E3A|nr:MULTISPECIES: efflux RND transporter periplasmic adaptor subunit [Alphaproteobacteria]
MHRGDGAIFFHEAGRRLDGPRSQSEAHRRRSRFRVNNSVRTSSMKKSHMKLVAGLVFVAALAAGGYIFMQNRPLNVGVVTPSETVPIRVFGLGTVEARVLSNVGFEVSGTVTELHADHGDRVEKGAILARLDSAEQQARLEQAKATQLAAQTSILKAEANVRRAEAVYAQRLEDSNRKQSLASRNAITGQEAGEALRDEKVAAADLSVAKSEVEVAKAQLTDAIAKLSYEETILQQHVLRAPYDGVVIDRRKEVGSVISSGEVMFTLVQPDTIWTLAYVDEEQAGALEVGLPAEIRMRSRPNTAIQGRVARIGLESDRANEERKVWVKCNNCPQQPYLGEQAEVWITVKTLAQALMVPQNAIYDFDGLTGKVWVLEDGRLRRIKLTFGYRSEDARYEVTGGLPEGASIVTSRGPGLKEGRSATALQGKS